MVVDTTVVEFIQVSGTFLVLFSRLSMSLSLSLSFSLSLSLSLSLFLSLSLLQVKSLIDENREMRITYADAENITEENNRSIQGNQQERKLSSMRQEMH
jgi:hypothetical protein